MLEFSPLLKELWLPNGKIVMKWLLKKIFFSWNLYWYFLIRIDVMSQLCVVLKYKLLLVSAIRKLQWQRTPPVKIFELYTIWITTTLMPKVFLPMRLIKISDRRESFKKWTIRLASAKSTRLPEMHSVRGGRIGRLRCCKRQLETLQPSSTRSRRKSRPKRLTRFQRFFI